MVATLSKTSAVEKGDLNATLNLDCIHHAAVMNGKSNGHVTIYSTGDRSKNGSWQVILAALGLPSANFKKFVYRN